MFAVVVVAAIVSTPHIAVVCVWTTPFGKPVVPDVYMMYSMSSSRAVSRFGRRRRITKSLIAARKRGDRFAIVDLQPLRDVGPRAARVQFADRLQKLFAVDQPCVPLSLSMNSSSSGDEPPVQRHDDRADFCQRKVRLHEFGAVHQQQTDPFALA